MGGKFFDGETTFAGINWRSISVWTLFRTNEKSSAFWRLNIYKSQLSISKRKKFVNTCFLVGEEKKTCKIFKYLELFILATFFCECQNLFRII